MFLECSTKIQVMYTITFNSENPDDLKLLALFAKRIGIVVSNSQGEEKPSPEYLQGLEEGIIQGMEQGLIEGIERGALNKAFELARNMKASGFDKRTILDITHLISEDIEHL